MTRTKQDWLNVQINKLISGFNKRQCSSVRTLALQKTKENNLHNTSIYTWGICSGYSQLWINNLCKQFDIKYNKFYAADGFCGLPKEIEGVEIESSWTEKNYSTLDEFHCETIENAVFLIKNFFAKYQFFPELIVGFFENSLPKLDISKLNPASFIDIDSDLYSSAKTILTWMIESKLIVPGTIINYDDYYGCDEFRGGESLAHKEWIEKYNIDGQLLKFNDGVIFEVYDI